MRTALIAACTVLIACNLPLMPDRANVNGAVEVRPEVQWIDWYQRTADCMRVNEWLDDSVSPSRVRWFLADSIGEGKDRHFGLFRPDHSIYLDRWRGRNEWMVRHESVHEILYNTSGESNTHEHQAFDNCVPDRSED